MESPVIPRDMFASQQIVYRNGLEQIDPLMRTMRIVQPRSRRFWYAPHLVLGAFIATLWTADLVAHVYFHF